MHWLIILAIGVYTFFDSVTVGHVAFQRELYGVVVILSVLVLVTGIIRKKKLVATGLLWVAGSTVFLVPVFSQPIIYEKYIVGDVVSMVLPAIMYMCGRLYSGLFEKRYSIVALSLLLGLSSLYASVQSGFSERYQPPSVMLVGAAWVWTISANNWRSRFVAFAMAMAILVVSWMSAQRTIPIIWMFAAALSVVVMRIRSLKILTGALVAVMLVAAIYSGKAEAYMEDMLEDTRYERMLPGEEDMSLLGRYYEAKDVWRTSRTEWQAYHYLIGYGHGATFLPFESIAEANLTKERRIHNVHFGPMLIYYRYGALGIAVLLYLVFKYARWFIKYVKKYRRGKAEFNEGVFYVTALLFTLDFAVRNPIVDPVFSYTLAGVAIFGRRMDNERRETNVDKGVYIEKILKLDNGGEGRWRALGSQLYTR